MNYLKNIYKTIVCIILVSGLISCYEEPDFLGDNTTSLASFPVAAFITGNESTYDENDIVSFQLQFWSDEEMDVINVYSSIDGANATLESSSPFTPNFSEELDLHLLDLTYTVPSGTSGSTIEIEVEVVNKNTLTDSRSFSFTVN
ncbi:MAG: hypothetical protein AAF901_00540 [Bacteroidota bacterium]